MRYIELLERFISVKKIENVLDLGCGDWQFSRYINWSKVNYVGVDVVQNVVNYNNEHLASDNVSFVKKDLQDIKTLKELFGKENQLVIIKDVLQHWSDDELLPWLNDFVLLDFNYALITNGDKYYMKPEYNDGRKRNTENKYSYAPLDLENAPYNNFGFTNILKYSKKKVALYDNRKR